MLAEEIMKNGVKAMYEESFDDIAKLLAEKAKKGDVVMTMGAGGYL